jgi:sugar lactone lactonase YvrE
MMTIVADYGDECGESPLWDADAGMLFWSDCARSRFYGYAPATDHHEIVKAGLPINRCLLRRGGGFIVANNNGLWSWDAKEKVELIVDRIGNLPLQLNDAVADSRGRVFTGTCFYNSGGHYALGQLVRVDNDGRASILDDGFHLANGLAFSRDERILYFADSVARRIYAYDFDIESGGVRNRRTLVQVPDDEGLPDGLTVDSEGFLWSAQWFGSSVVRYDPQGRVDQRLVVPAKQVSSVAFGDADLRCLFITTAAKPEPMNIMPPRYDPFSGQIGGPLFCVRTSICGMLQNYACL